MNRWVVLVGMTLLFLVGGLFLAGMVEIHTSWNIMVAFFTIQAMVLFRLDALVPEEWSVQLSLVKVVIRLLSSLIFILILVLTQENLFSLVIQFIILYLSYMIFEIVEALTNLRRN